MGRPNANGAQENEPSGDVRLVSAVSYILVRPEII